METYEQREKSRAHSAMANHSHAPLADRQAARAEYQALLRNPERFDHILDMVLAGNYGEGVLLACIEDILPRKRANRAAALGIVVAAVGCSCPARFAAQAYLGLFPEERAAIDAVTSAYVAAFDARGER